MFVINLNEILTVELFVMSVLYLSKRCIDHSESETYALY